MRSQLLSYLTTATSTATIKVVSELPWNTAGEPLYLKNMKKMYLDQEQRTQTTLIPTVNDGDVYQDDLVVRGYFAVDAKNQPQGLDSALAVILGARNLTGVDNFGNEADYSTEITDDVITYTVEWRLNTTTY